LEQSGIVRRVVVEWRRHCEEAAVSVGLNRRALLLGAGGAALAGGPAEAAVDYTIRIKPVTLELAPGVSVRTTAYDGKVPGPVLRMREGRKVAVLVVNEAGYPDLVHWHGQDIPSLVDGAMEEGSPVIAPGKSLIYRFAPGPAGTRWYHSHAMSGRNLSVGTYSGEFGFAIVEPANDLGRYDREILLAAHHWRGEWVSMQDLRKGPPPDNGLEVMYHAATLGQRMLGHGEPVRVRAGERVLFRLLNASATMNISLALPGHRFNVVALDGNKVPMPGPVDVLRIAAAERVDAIVEMNNPGVWVLGSADERDRAMGMGVVVEYANQRGQAQWLSPPASVWDYAAFGTAAAAATPDEIVRLKFEKIPGGRGGFNRWTINGRSWRANRPGDAPMLTVQRGRRYRLVMENHSGDSHPVHLHRHSFEVTRIGDRATSGVMKDVLNMPRFSTAEIDFVADNPGPTLFHCHHQDHMDEGFAGLIRYG
jgi:FtsP/CotA-like multicopper oxidase with cupredoxin domain